MPLFLACIGIIGCGALQARAEQPTFGQEVQIVHPEFGPVTVAVLHDYYVTDPRSQVVVIDASGHLLAASKLSDKSYIYCTRSGSKPVCRGYDWKNWLLSEPVEFEWKRTEIIKKNGHPTRFADPDITYGFVQRPMTFFEVLYYQVSAILSSSFSVTFGVGWWCLTLSFVAYQYRQYWRDVYRGIPKPRCRDISKLSNGFHLMFSVTAISWVMYPYSNFFLAVVCSLGGYMAFALAKERELRNHWLEHLNADQKNPHKMKDAEE